MARTLRVMLVVCLTAAFVILPCLGADAGDLGVSPAADTSDTLPERKVWRSAVALVPTEARLMRQVVASTNESKMLLGLGAAGAVVGGLGMLAYGASSSCKGKAGNSTAMCERVAVIGAVAVAGGAMTLALWALSR